MYLLKSRIRMDNNMELLTGNKDFQKSRSVLSASATFVAQYSNMMRDPAARDEVDVSHGN